MVLRAEVLKMVGVEGFEPPTYWSQTSRASRTALYPDTKEINYTADWSIGKGRKQKLIGNSLHRVGFPFRRTILRDRTVAAFLIDIFLAAGKQQHDTAGNDCQKKETPLPRHITDLTLEKTLYQFVVDNFHGLKVGSRQQQNQCQQRSDREKF